VRTNVLTYEYEKENLHHVKQVGSPPTSSTYLFWWESCSQARGYFEIASEDRKNEEEDIQAGKVLEKLMEQVEIVRERYIVNIVL